jgi:hypothetical protein
MAANERAPGVELRRMAKKLNDKAVRAARIAGMAKGLNCQVM